MPVLRCLGVGAVLITLGIACTKQAESADPREAAFTEFSHRVDSFMVLHQRLADSVGPLDVTKSQPEIAARATLLANAIIAARAGAKPGDIFTTGAATFIATAIKEEYSRRPAPVKNSREDAQTELEREEVADFDPAINQLWPTQYPLPTFPASLLPLLPKLPEALEYRVVKHYLLLRDIEANLIIDFMPNAVPNP